MMLNVSDASPLDDYDCLSAEDWMEVFKCLGDMDTSDIAVDSAGSEPGTLEVVDEKVNFTKLRVGSVEPLAAFQVEQQTERCPLFQHSPPSWSSHVTSIS